VRIFDFAKDYEILGVEELKYVDVEKAVNEAVSLFPDLHGGKDNEQLPWVDCFGRFAAQAAFLQPDR
jgi:hypothetical protein